MAKPVHDLARIAGDDEVHLGQKTPSKLGAEPTAVNSKARAPADLVDAFPFNQSDLAFIHAGIDSRPLAVP